LCSCLVAPSQLDKGLDAKLLGASQAAFARVASVALNDSRRACPLNEHPDQRKQGLAAIYEKSPRGLGLEDFTVDGKSSKSVPKKSAAFPCHCSVADFGPDMRIGSNACEVCVGMFRNERIMREKNSPTNRSVNGKFAVQGEFR
jgi:hypothetical protein